MKKKLYSAISQLIGPGLFVLLYSCGPLIYSQEIRVVNVPYFPGQSGEDIPHPGYNGHATRFKAIARGNHMPEGLDRDRAHFRWDMDQDPEKYGEVFTAGGGSRYLIDKSPGTGISVNTHTGNLFVKIPMLWFSSLSSGCQVPEDMPHDAGIDGMPYECSPPPIICYNSGKTRKNGGYGHGVASFFDVYLKVDLPVVTVSREEGRDVSFSWDGLRFVPGPGVFDSLTAYLPGQYRLRTKYGARYYFDDPGHYKITSKVDRNGNTTTYAYDLNGQLAMVTFPNNRQVSLEWEEGHVARIIDLSGSPGRITTLKYNVFDELTEIHHPGGLFMSFSYGYWGNIQSITDGSGHTLYIEYNESKAVSRMTYPDAGMEKLFSYDPGPRVTAVTEILGASGVVQTTQYAYDPDGRVTSIIYPDMSTRQFGYDIDNNILSYTNENGKTWLFTYDGRGNMTSMKDPLNNMAEWTYDPVFNRVLTFSDPDNHPTYFHYDNRGNLDSLVDAEGNKKSYTYDVQGKILSVKDKRGNTTTFGYDSFFDVIYDTDPLGNSSTYTYDTWGNLLTATDKKNGITRYSYDSLNRLVRIKNPAGDSIRFRPPPDSFFDVYFDLVINESGDSVQYAYDAAGRVTKYTDPLKRSTEFSYDEVGNLLSVKDAAGNYTHRTYDLRNRPVSIHYPASGIENLFYDAAGNLTSYLNQNGQPIYFYYDDAGRLVSVQDAEGNLEDFGYDAAGNWILYTDPRGNDYYMTWDDLNRLHTVIGPAYYTEEAAYDPEGNLISLTDANAHTTTYQYDALNRLTHTMDAHGNQENRTYDAESNLTGITDKNGNQTTYEYDVLHRRVSITDALWNVEYYGYDQRGNRTSWTDKNGNLTEYEFDKADQLIKKTDALGNEDIFGYDLNGHRISHTDRRGNMTQFNIDALGRMTARIDPLGNAETFNYDFENNLVNYIDKLGQPVNYSYDALNRLQTMMDMLGNVESYGYDEAGNLTYRTDRNGHTTTYRYDPLNRLVKTIDPIGNADSIAYDPAGRVVRSIDRNGNETSYIYDCCHLVNRVDPFGNIETYAHDPAGNLVKYYDKRGLLTRYEYDELNRPVKATDTLGHFMTYHYDAAGNTLAVINKNDDTTRYTYDVLGRLTESKDPYKNASTYAYDEVGNRITATNRLGHATEYEYDALNRLVKKTDPMDYEEEFVYNATGRLISKTDKNGNVTQYSYDPLSRLQTVTDAASQTSHFSYDPVGNLLTRQDRRGYVTTYVYDAADRVVQVKNPKNIPVQYTYDPGGRVIQKTDRNGHHTYYTYDGLNRLVQRTDAMGYTNAYTYDASGNMTEFTDANGNTRYYEYDSLDRLSKVITALGKVTEYDYDPAGNLVVRTTPPYDMTYYEYDKNQRLKTTTYPNGRVVEIIYDTEMLPLEIFGNGPVPDSTILSRDPNGRITSTLRKYGDLFSKTTSYSYDPNGNIQQKIQIPDTTRYGYNNLDRLTWMKGPAGDSTRFFYDPEGMRQQVILGNGVRAGYVYDNTDFLMCLTWEKPDFSPIVSYSYTYDNEGQKLSLTEIYPAPPAFTTNYIYDNLDRLTNVNTSWGNITGYVYDGAGNRTDKFDNGLQTIYNYNADNQLTQESGPSGIYNYTYDDRGNMTTRQDPLSGQVTSFGYDHENRLVQVNPSFGPPVSYDYFAPGQRMSRTASPTVYYNYTCSYCEGCCQWYCETDYTYEDDGDIIDVMSSGPYTDEHLSLHSGGGGGMGSYYVTDGIGNVTILTDGLGNEIASWEYDAFGKITYQYGMSSNTFNFQGKSYDPVVGQYDYVHRQYDPSTGRFTGMDPIFTEKLSGCGGGGGGGCNRFVNDPFAEDARSHTSLTNDFFGPGSDPFEAPPASHHMQGLLPGSMNNLYAFVNNNPVNYIDPLGLAYLPGSARASLNGHSPVNPWHPRNLAISGLLGPVTQGPAAVGNLDGCGPGGACSCGTPGLISFFGTTSPCFVDKFGETSCDLSKPSCANFDKKVYNKKCTSVCTDKHEDQHQKDLKECCDKGREAYGAVMKKWADTYRNRGLGKKTLEKKLNNLANDHNVKAETAPIEKKWENYGNAARRWTECNADQVSIDCADQLWKDYKCDCPPPANKQCCKDIEDYKKIAEARKKAKKCPKVEEGEAPLKGPECPF